MEIEIRRSDEGLTLETSAFLRWLIYVFNPVVNTKLPAILSHRRSTTVSLETYPLNFGAFIFPWLFWRQSKGKMAFQF